MTKQNQLKWLMLTCFAGAFTILFHQYVNWGKWFEINDFLHHEVFAGLLIAFGLAIYMTRRKMRRR